MTHQVTGTVTNLGTRSLTSKAGKSFTKHTVELDSGQKFECDGFKQKFAIGQKVNGLVVAENYKQWTEQGRFDTSLPSLGGAGSTGRGAPTPGATGSGSGGSSKGVFPISPSDGQMSIIRQNALTNANATVMPILVEALKLQIDSSDSDLSAIEKLIQATLERAPDEVLKAAYKYASFSSGQYDKIVGDELAKKVRGALGKADSSSAAE